MTAYLLDTQTFLLWRLGDASLGRRAARALAERQSEIHLSTVSVWEISIKRSLGKLQMDVATRHLVETAVSAGVRLLPIHPEHLYAMESLPWHHRDPFDRLLISQALCESMTVLGRDSSWASYGVRLVW